MFCSKCGKKIDEQTGKCLNCMNNQNNSKLVTNNINKFSNLQKVIIGLLLTLFIVLLISYSIISKKGYGLNDGTRTIMMYIVGSNLESDASIVTAELAAIDPNEIDLNKTNVIIYTGGTKKWHNFIKNDENAIYKLTKDGFEKIENYEQLNMGDPDTLSDFLNYAYENYPSENYDLIMCNHGGAIQGAIYDDFTNDNLSLSDISMALKDSHFNKKNKMESIIFRTCLNGTTEVADIFSNYAEYMVASEEITWGNNTSDVLGFINDLEEQDD